MLRSFPHFVQLDSMDCGPTCLRIVAKHYGKTYSVNYLRDISFLTREGVSMLGISDAAESIGFRTTGALISLNQLKDEVPLPCILHWKQNHFVVCYDIKIKKSGSTKIFLSDPAFGLMTYEEKEFKALWCSTIRGNEDLGAVLLLEPSPSFYFQDDESKETKHSLRFFSKYLIPYRKELIQMLLGVGTTSILQLILPFLMQSLVDSGINGGNMGFITLILICQLVLSISQVSVSFISSWIALHMHSRLDIALISDFLIKVMKLPIAYFDSKLTGDIMQRIGDHGRIKSFLTGNLIELLFSFLNFFIYSFILAYYNTTILFIFLIGNALNVGWILLFLKYRKELDHKRFAVASDEQSNMVQLISGMQEIKLNNYEKQKRWQWERIQIKLFKLSTKGLAIGQIQQVGSILSSQITGIFISYLSVKSVVEGEMTLGMMMSVSYLIGQLSGPIGSLIGFVQSFQDAKISLERLNEIHGKEDEDQKPGGNLNYIPEVKDIIFENVSFSYDGADRDYVLQDVNIHIPRNKVTAIVGVSGSGKTTLIKLLLGFYEPNKGTIKVGDIPLNLINLQLWRSKTGCVMQDGFIFSETIANNIIVGDSEIDGKKLQNAAKVANIEEFIDSLPLKYNTKIGMEGKGISQGQKQRILIARAVYKNPEFIILDEATNSLDSTNEHQIILSLKEFYVGKTVIIVAHRLSTVREADSIIVLHNGKIVEEGTHEELVKQRGEYFELVKNQLELGL